MNYYTLHRDYVTRITAILNYEQTTYSEKIKLIADMMIEEQQKRN